MVSTTPQYACVFVDRDGAVIVGKGNTRPDQVQLLPGVAAAICRLLKAGYLVIIITNQDGQNDGQALTQAEVDAIHDEVRKQLGPDALPTAFRHCPHLKNANTACQCRKPKPGLILSAAAEFNVDLKRSVMVGDRWIDVHAGLSAGIPGILVLTGPDGAHCTDRDQIPAETPIYDTLGAFVDCLLAQK